MTEPLGKVVVYMGEEGIRVYTNVRPIFGVRKDTQAENNVSKNPMTKSFPELLKECIEKNTEEGV